MVKYLSVMDVLAMNQRILEAFGQEHFLRDEGGLESAVMRPQMVAHYGQADIVVQTATLVAGIALAHAFLDGNKRTAEIAGVTFLALNGLRIQKQQLDVAKQVEAIVNREGSLDNAIEDFAEWLRPRVVPFN